MYRSSTRTAFPVAKTFVQNRTMHLMTVAVLSLVASRSFAQISRDILTTSNPLTPTQRGEVQAYVDQNVTTLLGDDLKATLQARRALEDPMKDASARRPFRLAYDDVLTPQLTDAVDDPATPVHLQVACLHLLGSVASDASLDALTAHLQSTRPTTRYAAASGIQRAFEAAQAGRATFDADKRMIELMQQLRTAIGSEKQGETLMAEVSACVAAPGKSGTASAVEAASRGLIAQYQNFHRAQEPDDRVSRLHQCMQLVYQRFIKVVTFGQDMKPAQKALIESAACAITMACELAQSMSEQDLAKYQDDLNELVGTSESILNLFYRAAGQEDTQVSRTFQTGQFQQAGILFERRWLTDDGPIYKNSEYGFRPGHFEKLLEG